jgi:hypothetical protein
MVVAVGNFTAIIHPFPVVTFLGFIVAFTLLPWTDCDCGTPFVSVGLITIAGVQSILSYIPLFLFLRLVVLALNNLSRLTAVCRKRSSTDIDCRGSFCLPFYLHRLQYKYLALPCDYPVFIRICRCNVIIKYLLGSVGLKVYVHLVFFLVFIRICWFESQRSPCIFSRALSLVRHVRRGKIWWCYWLQHSMSHCLDVVLCLLSPTFVSYFCVMTCRSHPLQSFTQFAPCLSE